MIYKTVCEMISKTNLKMIRRISYLHDERVLILDVVYGESPNSNNTYSADTDC